jgi:hypothetical protein
MECAACFVDTSADGATKDPVANAARFLQNSGTPHPHSGGSSPLVRSRNREVGTRTRIGSCTFCSNGSGWVDPS